jgi:hypothetical protein
MSQILRSVHYYAGLTAKLHGMFSACLIHRNSLIRHANS